MKVLFFGILKDVVQRESDILVLPANATLEDLLRHFSELSLQFKQFLPSIAFSVNQEYATPATELKQGDEVALLPPVSGGSSDHFPEEPTQLATNPRAMIVKQMIVKQKIDTGQFLDNIKQPSHGAVVVFEGIVRNNTRGRRTLYLDYESYEEMALKQMELLAEKALAEFKVRDVRIVHRLGRLLIGETSVLIVVASEHRAAAFDACRWLIDTLKRTVPIWKKEYFEDGAVWADGEPFPIEISGGEGTH